MHQEGEIVVRVVEIGRIQLRVETDTGACLETVGLDFKSIDKYQVRALLKGNAIGFRFKDEKVRRHDPATSNK